MNLTAQHPGRTKRRSMSEALSLILRARQISLRIPEVRAAGFRPGGQEEKLFKKSRLT